MKYFEAKMSYPQFLKYLVPSVLTMIFLSFYTTIDGFFVSRYAGSDALAGFQKNTHVGLRSAKPYMAVFQKIDKADQHAYCNGEKCSPCSSKRSQSEYSHKNIVENNIKSQTCQRHDHSDVRSPIRPHKIFKK